MDIQPQRYKPNVNFWSSSGTGSNVPDGFSEKRYQFSPMNLTNTANQPDTLKKKLVGGIPTPLKKYESQLGLLFPMYGKKAMFQTNQKTNSLRFVDKNPYQKMIRNLGIRQQLPIFQIAHSHHFIPWVYPQGLRIPRAINIANWWFNTVFRR